MIDAAIFGIAIYGDGAMINTVPKINTPAAGHIILVVYWM
jgi:hypothetical protein